MQIGAATEVVSVQGSYEKLTSEGMLFFGDELGDSAAQGLAVIVHEDIGHALRAKLAECRSI